MGPFSWQGQKLCGLSMTFILDWRVVMVSNAVELVYYVFESVCCDGTGPCVRDGAEPPFPAADDPRPRLEEALCSGVRRREGPPLPGLDTNSIIFCFLFVKKPRRGNTFLFRSSQQLPRPFSGPLKGFLS